MTEQQVTEIHLVGPGFSGRAVRYRVLDIDELDEVERAMGHEIRSMPNAATMSNAEYLRLLQRYGLPKILHSFTEPVTKEALAAKDGVKWTPATPEMFDPDVGGLKRYFRAKDINLLRTIFMREHDVGQKEVEEVLAGKVETLV